MSKNKKRRLNKAKEIIQKHNAKVKKLKLNEKLIETNLGYLFALLNRIFFSDVL